MNNPNRFKFQIGLEMPMDRPSEAHLCEECHMKHAHGDECWDGMLPSGHLPLPALDGETTGRELVDENPGTARKKKLKGAKRV